MSEATPYIHVGVKAIARRLGLEERQTHYLCSKRRLPAFKWGTLWAMRENACAPFFARLEAEAAATTGTSPIQD